MFKNYSSSFRPSPFLILAGIALSLPNVEAVTLEMLQSSEVLKKFQRRHNLLESAERSPSPAFNRQLMDDFHGLECTSDASSFAKWISGKPHVYQALQGLVKGGRLKDLPKLSAPMPSPKKFSAETPPDQLELSAKAGNQDAMQFYVAHLEAATTTQPGWSFWKKPQKSPARLFLEESVQKGCNTAKGFQLLALQKGKYGFSKSKRKAKKFLHAGLEKKESWALFEGLYCKKKTALKKKWALQLIEKETLPFKDFNSITHLVEQIDDGTFFEKEFLPALEERVGVGSTKALAYFLHEIKSDDALEDFAEKLTKNLDQNVQALGRFLGGNL